MLAQQDGSVYVWGQFDESEAVTPDLLVPPEGSVPLPCTHPTLLRMGNLLDTSKEGMQVFRMSDGKTSDGKQQKGQRHSAPRRCKKGSDGKQLAADAFTAAPSLQKVLSADIGLYTGALVTDDGELYTFGFGDNGGHGLGIRDVAVPTRVRGGLEHERVVLVRIGNCFAAVLTASGRVWTFGRSNVGQLGTGVMRSQVMPPRLLEGHISQFKIVQVSCGSVHTIALTETGRLFSWGCNTRGQLGLGDFFFLPFFSSFSSFLPLLFLSFPPLTT
jgi:alpha-tubulin suppressor-like RCC1 family protein